MKKLINILAILNRILIITTVLLYITIYLGLLSQIVLGGFQVIAFLILLFFLNKLSRREQLMLLVYFILTSLFFLGWYLISEVFKISLDNHLAMGLMILIPIGIAVYFTYIIEQIKEKII